MYKRLLTALLAFTLSAQLVAVPVYSAEGSSSESLSETTTEPDSEVPTDSREAPILNQETVPDTVSKDGALKSSANVSEDHSDYSDDPQIDTDSEKSGDSDHEYIDSSSYSEDLMKDNLNRGANSTGAHSTDGEINKDLEELINDTPLSDGDESNESVANDWGANLMELSKLQKRTEKLVTSGILDGTITIAVIDTGINSSHPWFSGRIDNRSKSFIEGATDYEDKNGHGSHVAGIIAHYTPSSVKIMVLQALNENLAGSPDDIYDAIVYAADNGADIINLSLGVTKDKFKGNDSLYDKYKTSLSSAIAAAEGKDVDILITTFYQEGGNTEFDEGVKEFINGDPTNLANNGGNDMVAAVTAMGFDAYNVALAAMQAAGSTAPADILAALPGVVVEDAVSGKIQFDENGDAIRNSAFVKTANTETGTWDFVAETSISE